MKRALLFLFLILSLKIYGQTCTLSVNIAATSTTICSGNAVTLTANATAGTPGYNYVWSTGDSTQSITINKAATYSVIVTDNTPGCQPVTQSIVITSGTVPLAPTVVNVNTCPNTAAILTPTAPGGVYQWYDAPTGGNFLGTGNSFTTPIITAQKVFYVETTLDGCTSMRSAVVVTPGVGPVVNHPSTCAGSSLMLTASGASSYKWYDAPGGTLLGTDSTYTTAALFATTTYYVVATSSTGCISDPTAVVATVLPSPSAPVAPSVATCYATAASLHATSAPGAIYDWFTAPSGGTSLISGPDFTTPVLTATTTYYVQVTLNGCISIRTPVVVTVNPIPTVPTAPDVTTCTGSAATLTATASGGTFEWFDTPTSTIPLGTGSTFTTPALNSAAVYYVQVTNLGCTSPRATVNVTVNPIPTPPTAPDITICSGTAGTITALGPGGSYDWYDAPTGGNLLANGTNFTTPVIGATTQYYVQTTIAGCTSARTTVTVTVKPIPTAPTAAGQTICTGSSAVLTASGGSSYQWYSAATGGTLLASTSNYSTPALSANTTYYVQNTSGGCVSSRTPVTVTVSPAPAVPASSDVTVCSGTAAHLTATASAGTIQWYNAASGGTQLGTGANYTTPNLSATTTYYIQTATGSCTSARVPVTVNVYAPTNQFVYTSGTFCNSGTVQSPVINIPGGVFTFSPAGLVLDPVTGQINVAASTPGVYTITYATPCGITTAQVNIVTSPSAGFTYASTGYCQDGINPAPLFTTGSAGVFTAPAGLVFVDNITGVINLAASTPGTYVITNTIGATTACAPVADSYTVTIYKKVTVNAGPDQTVAIGANAQLAGAVSGGVTTGTWSGGAGTFSNSNLLNAVYTPGAGETGSVTLTLTSADPGNACGPKSDVMIITFNPAPAAPTALGTTICPGSVATVTATAPGGSYKWFNASTGGTQLASTASYTSPALTANTIYWVQTTVGGVTGPRTAVLVTVLPVVTPPIAPSITSCSGSTATLMASGSAGTYEWYTASTGGSLLGSGSSYTTPYLTANASYYVQTTVNGCISARTKVDVTISPIVSVTSATSGTVCSGNAQNYNITADVAGATYTWTRAAVAGVSNPAVASSSAIIDEILINTTISTVIVNYVITPIVNGCSGVPFNYPVTVYPTPALTSASNAIVCSGSSPDYDITFNVPSTFFTWSRAVVAGISNPAVTGQTSSRIQEILTNTTNAPVDVTYVITSNTANCPGQTYNVVITVNPKVFINSPTNGNACSATPLNYTITSNVPTAVFSWSRAVVAGISNPAVSGYVSGSITETLFNTDIIPITVNYVITIISNGCQLAPFTYSVVVYPQPPTPVANSNSPVCSGSIINLLTPTVVAGTTYLWTGPNGFSSTDRNPVITNVTAANNGTYVLYLVSNSCTSVGDSVAVAVDAVPIVNAGADQSICNPVGVITLAGDVHGGTITGIWTTNGTGVFFPSAKVLNGQYIPSAQDRINGSVKLTLASTSKDDCAIATDELILKILPLPVKPGIQ